jgi:hypothetical protein
MRKYISKKFTKQQLIDIAFDDDENFETIENKIIDQTRWSTIHNQIFRDKSTGKFYETEYAVGSTESQYEGPYEFEYFKEREIFEVRQIEKIVKAYELVPIQD